MKPLFYQGQLIQKVLIVGMGLSGRSVFTWLTGFQVQVDRYDAHHNSDYACFTAIDLFGYDLIVVSPGIPLNQAPYQRLLSFRSRVISDIDLFCAHAHAPIIAVTGSNGKSTVVSLLAHILRAQGFTVGLGGNIGAAALDVLDEQCDYYVLELSSFQIDLLHRAHFSVGMVLNISADHLDRYADLDAYALSKCSLASFSKTFICPFEIAENYSVAHSNLIYFDVQDGYTVEGCQIYVANGDRIDTSRITSLVGQHNVLNIAYVYAGLKALGVAIVTEDFLDAVQSFKGLPHRCEWVAKVDGVTYIDDSKGTNMGATIAAIEGLAKHYRGVVLLLGGVGKGANFAEMIPTLKQYVKHCFVYGQDGGQIFSQITGEVQATLCHNALAAFAQASDFASEGDLVLLSPACASFDEFKNYAHRGEVFAQFVQRLKEN